MFPSSRIPATITIVYTPSTPLIHEHRISPDLERQADRFGLTAAELQRRLENSR